MFPVSFRMKAIQNVFIVAYKAHIYPHPLSVLISSIFLLTPSIVSIASLLFNNMPRISHLRFSLSGMLSPPGSSTVYSSSLDLYSNVMFLGLLATLSQLQVLFFLVPIFPVLFIFSQHFSKLNILSVLPVLFVLLSITFYWSRNTLRAELFPPFFVLHPQC